VHINASRDNYERKSLNINNIGMWWFRKSIKSLT